MRAWGSNFQSKKNFNFARVILLNWLAKIELRGPGALIVNIIVNYCPARLLLHAKMLIDTETEVTIGFVGTFL